MSAGDAGLAEALRAIPGVADAEVDEAEEPTGIRVRLTVDADPDDVAAAVREVLAGRGLRSRLAPAPEHIEPAEAPPPPTGNEIEATVLPGPGWEAQPSLLSPPDGAPDEAQISDSPTPVQPEAPVSPEPRPERRTGLGRGVESVIPVEPEPGLPGRNAVPGPAAPAPEAPPPAAPAPEAPAAQAQVGRAGLAAILLEERRSTVTVTAIASDGRSVSRRAPSNEAGMQSAVVACVAELLDPGGATPLLTTVEESTLAGERVVTVVLDGPEGVRRVGASAVGAERSFAIGRAAWSALTEGA